MKKYLVITFAWMMINTISCRAQIINNNMEDYDFKTMDSSTVNPLGIEHNGWIIVMFKMTESGTYYNEFPPAPNFYRIVKTFYPNGRLKSKGKLTGQLLLIGVWQYFDEQGHLIKEVDEDKKFGKLKLIDILRFIEKEGYINLSTGEGRDYAVIEENNKGMIYYGSFSLTLNNENSYWSILIEPTRKNDFHKTIYHLDKDSGKVLYKNTERIQYIK